MAFTSTAPGAIPITSASFLVLFGAGGANVASVFASDSGEARFTFTAPFPGILVATAAGVAEAALVANIGGATGVQKSAWALVANGVSVTVRAPSSFVGDLVSLLVDFVSAPESIALTSATYSGNAPGSIGITSATYTGSAPVEIPVVPVGATAAYFGVSASTILDGNGITANLTVEASPTLPDTYAMAAGGYKYLAIPASGPALSTFKDNVTGFGIPLAGAGEGYNQTANSLSFASVMVGSAQYRLYRSANVISSTITIAVT